MGSDPKKFRIAALGDTHVNKNSQGVFQPIFSQVNDQADVLLLCGDLTDYGTKEEADILAKELTASVRIPIIAVLGNHDFESGTPEVVRSTLVDSGVTVLDGEAHEIDGIGFAGVKGFAGGFGRGTLGAWGEHAIKRFVQEAIDEALKLETALARLRTEQKIAVLHYSPVRDTVEGEPVEIFPFLGTSRLEEPLNRYKVSAVFHGHAHKGNTDGKTISNIPVYNVAMPLMKRVFPDHPPFRVIEVPRPVAVTEEMPVTA
jgi:Icc-related predicted phosphoesterase